MLGGIKGVLTFRALEGVGFAVRVGLTEIGVREGTLANRIDGAVFFEGDLDGTSGVP